VDKRQGRKSGRFPPSSAEFKDVWRYLPLPPHAFTFWCSIKHRDTCRFTWRYYPENKEVYEIGFMSEHSIGQVKTCLSPSVAFLIERSLQQIIHFCKRCNQLDINHFNAELNPICHLLALLEAHHIFHVSRIRVKSVLLTLTRDESFFVTWNTEGIETRRPNWSIFIYGIRPVLLK
jgi:hypothetical protein